mmetsp:Transcript_19268/g.55455  ORF Transcript_19268/g.55455 Transcript_19268/m.55455 type:complete len:292 (+) Transcript_19268:827-1702(+)
MASLMASLRVRCPSWTGTTLAPRVFMRKTLSFCRSQSTAPMYTVQSRPSMAQTVAVATPCCPAPVSAMMRGLPMRLARRAWPMALLILWAPVWARSSRLSQMVAPPAYSVRRAALCRGVGPPTKSLRYRAISAMNSGSSLIFAYSSSISTKASDSVSAMNCPPNSPKRFSALRARIFSESPPGTWPRAVAWNLAVSFCGQPVVKCSTMALTAAARWSVVASSPSASIVLRMAEPTTTPSAMLATPWTMSGLEMPKPTARGRSVLDRTRPTKSSRSGGSVDRAPVTPVTETQ